MLQAKGAAPPEYEVKAESGPDHRKRFLVEVVIPAAPAIPPVTAQGTGTTKKRAEQEAARVAFQQLHEQETVPVITQSEQQSAQPAEQPKSATSAKRVTA
jgi:ribonuclease-3